MIDDCSKNCGNGTRTKHRTKTLNEANGGICNGTETEEENCNTQDCAGKLPTCSHFIFIKNEVLIHYVCKCVYVAISIFDY